MATLCVSCGVSKSKFHNLRSKKCALNEKESIIKFLVNSNLDFNPPTEEIFLRGLTPGEQLKKNFYCSIYEIISQQKWPSSYDVI